MSATEINHFASSFENSVIHFYQQKMQRLRATVRRKSVTNAKDLTFFRMGKSAAQERDHGEALVPGNPSRPTVTVTPVEINATEEIDRKTAKRLTYDIVDAIKMSHAAQLARSADGQIIAAAEAGFTASARTKQDFSADDPHLEQLVAMSGLLQSRDVPDEGMLTVVVSPEVWSYFILFDAFNSADWVPLGDSTINKKSRVFAKYWNGMYVVCHTGLTKTGAGATAKVDCLMYHESAIGHGTITDLRVETAPTLSNRKPGLLVNSYFDCGAVAIDDEGIEVFTMKNQLKGIAA